MICIEHITSSHAEPKLRQPLYFSSNLVLHFRRNGSRFREQRYCVSSPVCQTGVVHVLLQVEVTSVISILTCYVFRLNKTYLKMTPNFWFMVGLFLTVYSNHIKYTSALFIPCHTLVSGYYDIPFGVCPSVRPSVRPCSPFPIDNLSIYSRIFFKFCIHIVIGNEWYGIVNGQNPCIFLRSYCPFSYWKNGFWPVIPLLFMISE